MPTHRLLPLVAAFALLALSSCGSDEDPTSPASLPSIGSLGISIDGVEVANRTIERGMGSATLFRARPSTSMPGLMVHVDYDAPGSMMGGRHGSMMLYDDGSHGDPHAGDGEYCYEEHGEMMGMHAGGAMPGHYGFEFYCTEPGGGHGPGSDCWVDVR